MALSIQELLAKQKQKPLESKGSNGDTDASANATGTRTDDSAALRVESERGDNLGDSASVGSLGSGSASSVSSAPAKPRFNFGGIKKPVDAVNSGRGESAVVAGDGKPVEIVAGRNAGQMVEQAGTGVDSADTKIPDSNPLPSAHGRSPESNLPAIAGNSSVPAIPDGANRDASPAKRSGLLALASRNLEQESASGNLAQIARVESRSQGEVLPSAPERVLPAEMTEIQKGFVDSLDSMYLVFDDAGLFVNVVQRIMIDLKSHPDLMSIFAPEDSNVLMRGIRNSAGMAKVKKEETRAKTAGRAAPKAANVAEDKMEIMRKLALGGGFKLS